MVLISFRTPVQLFLLPLLDLGLKDNEVEQAVHC